MRFFSTYVQSDPRNSPTCIRAVPCSSRSGTLSTAERRGGHELARPERPEAGTGGNQDQRKASPRRIVGGYTTGRLPGPEPLLLRRF